MIYLKNKDLKFIQTHPCGVSKRGVLDEGSPNQRPALLARVISENRGQMNISTKRAINQSRKTWLASKGSEQLMFIFAIKHHQSIMTSLHNMMEGVAWQNQLAHPEHLTPPDNKSVPFSLLPFYPYGPHRSCWPDEL
jgi:hypothetical protein